MTNEQWNQLKRLVAGEKIDPMPVAFIIDCPWLPGWNSARIIDYFTDQQVWLESNLKAVREFPDVWFLPGFWSEFGMCTEPSAFGSKSMFPEDEFPHAHKVIASADAIDELEVPDPSTDGLLPFVLNRLKRAEASIREAGHEIRFAVARGPLNIASYLMGSTEFITTMMMMPEQAHTLMRKITDFLHAWIDLQRKTFPTIDGIFMLDDIIGFLGEQEFREFGLPYFQELYGKDVSVKFLHNDAPCRVCAPLLPEMGVNLFNMGFEVPLPELQELTRHQVTLMGNLPPRDVLAGGDLAQIKEETGKIVESLVDRRRILMSCGGGMPPGVASEAIRAFVTGARG